MIDGYETKEMKPTQRTHEDKVLDAIEKLPQVSIPPLVEKEGEVYEGKGGMCYFTIMGQRYNYMSKELAKAGLNQITNG